ncbi:pilus assembly protein TadG-related protein [Georgenia sp. Z1491]|uniref:pilus assembly protein TadG-related protein n=1 Tax=Georgenia sp. Z1491 TaxID=3416707 RepID=UPI003CF8DD04
MTPAPEQGEHRRRPAPRTTSAEEDPEAGRIMVLGIGFLVVLVALVLVIISVSAIHLDRKRALAAADAAASAAADAVAEAAFYAEERDALLTDETVRTEAAAYLQQLNLTSSGGIRSVEFGEPTGTEDGETAVVTLVAVVDPMFVPDLVSDAVGPVTITVTGRARAIDVENG